MRLKCVAISILLSTANILAAQTSDADILARIILYRQNFDDSSYGQSLVSRALAADRDVNVRRGVSETPAICVTCPVPDPTNDPETKRAVGLSDLVVIGHVVRSISSLTKNDRFIFTDVEFVIDDILKSGVRGGAAPKLDVGNEISIMRLGGTVVYKGKTLRATLSDHLALQQGHRYLMFLQYDPELKSFSSIFMDGFDLTGEKVIHLQPTGSPFTPNLLNDPKMFMQALRSSVSHALSEETR